MRNSNCYIVNVHINIHIVIEIVIGIQIVLILIVSFHICISVVPPAFAIGIVNRSLGVVELVRRDRLLFAKVEIK